MPIFSSNRISGIRSTVTANESYTEHDFGRILSECATNDMRLFNAALARDFQEVKAVQEGTMVTSELRALQEFSIKEAWAGLKEKVKKLWAKIKGVFRNVYAKLSLWINRNNKLYVAQNRKYLQQKKNLGKCEIKNYREFNIGNFSKIEKEYNSEFKDMLDRCMKLQDLSRATDLYNLDNKGEKELPELNIDDVFDDAQDIKYSDIKDENIGSLSSLFSFLSNGSKVMKDMKKENKKMDDNFKKLITAIDKAEKGSDKTNYVNDDEENKKMAKYWSERYSKASKYVSSWQTANTAYYSFFIKVYKKRLNVARGVIAALVAFDPMQESSTLTRFAYAAGYDALHEEVEDMTPDEVAEEAEAEGIEINIDAPGVDADDVDVTINGEDVDDDD